MTETFDTPGQADEGIPRDRYGRPLVVPPEGGAPMPYTRCTTYVSVLEDTYNLSRWQQRMVALGMADRPDLVLAAGAHRDDKAELDRIVAQALDAAQAHAAAGVGTSLHKLTEQLDRGQIPGPVPEAYRADIDAYAAATANLEMVGIERFTVLDELKIGGTHDRTVRYQGRTYIADIKTGSIEYSALKIAMQLAVYSRSVLYDHRTRTREPLDVDTDRAIVIHLPAGQGRCELHWVDIAAGWEAVQVATQVRDWRRRTGLLTPITDPVTEAAEKIKAAMSAEELTQIWQQHQSVWTDDLTALARARKAELLGSAR